MLTNWYGLFSSLSVEIFWSIVENAYGNKIKTQVCYACVYKENRAVRCAKVLEQSQSK